MTNAQNNIMIQFTFNSVIIQHFPPYLPTKGRDSNYGIEFQTKTFYCLISKGASVRGCNCSNAFTNLLLIHLIQGSKP